jgi:type I restriction enzyme R subunit
MSRWDTEADARIVVDDPRRRAGWDPTDKAQVRTEVTVRLGGRSVPIHEPPHPGPWPSESHQVAYSEDQQYWRTDYVLHDRNGHPLATVESKRKAIDPYTAKNQALPAAREIKAPFIFLCNGELIYFWDYETSDARLVSSFYSQRDLERLVHRLRNFMSKVWAVLPVSSVSRADSGHLNSHPKWNSRPGC